MDLRRQAAVILEAGGNVGDVEFGFDDRLAGIARLELGELVGARADNLGELEEHAAAILRGGVLPLTRIESGACRRDRPRHVGGVRIRDAAEQIPGRRVDDVDGRRRFSARELAVDVEVVVCQSQSLY